MRNSTYSIIFLLILLLTGCKRTNHSSDSTLNVKSPLKTDTLANSDNEVYNSVSEPWETLFHKTGGSQYEIASKKNNGFKIILNRYQNPLPMMQFDWKGYTVCYYDYFDISNNGTELGNIVQIRKNKKILYDIRGNSYLQGFSNDVDSYIKGEADPYDVFFRDVTSDKEPELFIHAGTKGAYSYWTMFIFRMTKNGPENILKYYTGRVGTLQTPEMDKAWDKRWNNQSWNIMDLRCYVRDIDSNGVPEMIMANSSIEHLCGETHGPYVLSILEWNGTQFIDKTRHFPELSRKAALGYADDSKDSSFPPEDDWSFIGEALMPYYANMILAGREKDARAWISKNGKGEILKWLNDKQKIQSIHKALEVKGIGKMKKYKEYVY